MVVVAGVSIAIVVMAFVAVFATTTAADKQTEGKEDDRNQFQ